MQVEKSDSLSSSGTKFPHSNDKIDEVLQEASSCMQMTLRVEKKLQEIQSKLQGFTKHVQDRVKDLVNLIETKMNRVLYKYRNKKDTDD